MSNKRYREAWAAHLGAALPFLIRNLGDAIGGDFNTLSDLTSAATTDLSFAAPAPDFSIGSVADYAARPSYSAGSDVPSLSIGAREYMASMAVPVQQMQIGPALTAAPAPFFSQRGLPASPLRASGTQFIPQKLSDTFLNKQAGGNMPPPSAIEVPRLPGRQGGPLEPAPVLTIPMRQACTTCGGDPNLELRSQRGDVEKSIKTEQQQLQRQTLEQQREEITRYQQEEQRGERTTDQEIRDKLALLDQINQEIASQQQGGVDGAERGYVQTGIPPSGSQPRFLDLLRTNLSGFVKDLTSGGECSAVLAKFGVPLNVAAAICLGYQQVKGDAKAITKWAENLVGSGAQGGSPTVIMPPPPPPPPQQVRFCMNCLDQNSALKFMSGQGSDGCFLEEEEHG